MHTTQRLQSIISSYSIVYNHSRATITSSPGRSRGRYSAREAPGLLYNNRLRRLFGFFPARVGLRTSTDPRVGGLAPNAGPGEGQDCASGGLRPGLVGLVTPNASGAGGASGSASGHSDRLCSRRPTGPASAVSAGRRVAAEMLSRAVHPRVRSRSRWVELAG